MTNPHPTRKFLLFGDCKLDLQMRMLWRGGALQQVEPRVFDVLELLISNRDRVVTREELHARVWTGVELTASALHRALAVLRQVIGADTSPTRMIRTVHRVGYQFVAPVDERFDSPVAVAPAPPAPAQRPASGLAIGLVWRDAVTPQSDLRAVKSRFGAALTDATQPRLGVGVTVVFVDSGLGPGPQSAPAGWSAAFDAVATVDLHADRSGCWLDWWVQRSTGSTVRRSLRGEQLDALLELAATGLSAVLAGDAAAQVADDFEDEFSARLSARASALMDAQDWTGAERLFDALAAAHPGHRTAVIGKLLTMIPRAQPAAAEAYAREQLAQAEAVGDPGWRLVARYGLLLARDVAGQAVTDPELTAVALKVLEAVDSHARPLPDLETRLINAHATEVALTAPLNGACTALLKRAVELCRFSGKAARAASLLGFLSAMALLRDEILLALVYSNDAVDLMRDEQAPSALLYAWANLAMLKMHVGEVGAATGLMDRAMNQFVGSQVSGYSAYPLSGLAMAALQVGDRQRLRHLAVLLDTGFQPPLSPDHPAKLGTQAGLALAEGQTATARALLWQVVGHPFLDSEVGVRAGWLLMLLRLELGAQGGGDGARCLKRLRPLAGGGPSPLLEAWSQRALAAERCSRGDRSGALAAQLDALAVAPGGMVQALCRLDAAWLLCEAGEAERAQLMWSAAGHWATEHPIGLAVKARLRALQGVVQEAVDAQAQALAAWRGARPALQEELLDHYRRLRAGGALPMLPGFASDAWWA